MTVSSLNQFLLSLLFNLAIGFPLQKVFTASCLLLSEPSDSCLGRQRFLTTAKTLTLPFHVFRQTERKGRALGSFYVAVTSETTINRFK